MIVWSRVYCITFPAGGGTVTTSLATFSAVPNGIPAGRHRIDEFVSRPGFLPPVARPWGWVVKREDGSVDIEPMAEPG